MTRLWAPKIKQLQDAIARQIEEERVEQSGELPEPLQRDNLEILVGLAPSRQLLAAHSIRVLMPRGTIGGDITISYEGSLYFPVQVRIGALQEGDALELLREAVGLVMDGVIRDHMLGEACEGPSGPDCFQVQDALPDGQGAIQDVICGFMVRSGP